MTPDRPDPRVRLLLRLGRALQVSGVPAYRLEDALAAVARKLEIPAQFFASPTSLLCAFGHEDEQSVRLLRVDVGDVDLARLTQLDEVLQSVLHGELEPDAAIGRIREIRSQPDTYGPVLSTLAFGLAAGGAAQFFGGGLREVAASAAIGILVALLALLRSRVAALGRLFEPVAAMAATLAVYVAASGAPAFSIQLATVSALIVLVPGFSLTVAMQELAMAHLQSGTARLLGAVMTFLTMIFGVAIASQIGSLLPPPLANEPVPLPAWTMWPALAVSPLAFGVLFRARRRDLPWIVVACVATFFAARSASEAFGPHLGVLLGAIAVGVLGNLIARARGIPATVSAVPALMLLVPGSIGFRSLHSMLAREALTAVDTAFHMVMVACALVTGLLVANAIVEPRRLL